MILPLKRLPSLPPLEDFEPDFNELVDECIKRSDSEGDIEMIRGDSILEEVKRNPSEIVKSEKGEEDHDNVTPSPPLKSDPSIQD